MLDDIVQLELIFLGVEMFLIVPDSEWFLKYDSQTPEDTPKTFFPGVAWDPFREFIRSKQFQEQG
jgi:hypothetical protein